MVYVCVLYFVIVKHKPCLCHPNLYSDVNSKLQTYFKLADASQHNDRTKHIDVQYHFTCEKVELGQVDFKYCLRRDMVEDTLAKPLPRVKFDQFRKALKLHEYSKLPS